MPRNLQSTINQSNPNNLRPQNLPPSSLNSRPWPTIQVSPCFRRVLQKRTCNPRRTRWSQIQGPTPRPNSKKYWRALKMAPRRVQARPESRGSLVVHSSSPWIRSLSHRRVATGLNWTRACLSLRARHSRFKHSISRAALRACWTYLGRALTGIFLGSVKSCKRKTNRTTHLPRYWCLVEETISSLLLRWPP